jgi:ion channel-forming bestrophin family protein
VRALMDICGACERITSSPLAGAYKNMIWLGVGGYMLALPWLLAPTLENWTVPFVIGGAYFVVGLELLAEEVERPFGHDVNDISLTPLCLKIEVSITEVMGHQFDLPSPADQYVTSH